MKKRILAIIPARGGSKSVPGKNIKVLGGRPLIAHTIKAALESKYIDRTIVSTDDEEIAKVARTYGAETPYLQPKKIAQYESSALSAVLYAINYVEKKEKYFPELIVYLQPTSPFRNSKHIDETIKLMLKNENLEGAFALTEVEQHPYMMFKKDEEGFMIPLVKKENRPLRRQELPEAYVTNASIYVTRREYFNDAEDPKPVCPIFNGKVKGIIIDRESSADINDQIDFHACESIIKFTEKEKTIKIGNSELKEFGKTFVIAEMAGGHNGNFENALKLIDIAGNSKADAIKLHMYKLKDYIVPSHKLYNDIKRLEFNKEEWSKIFKKAKEKKLVTADKGSLEMASKLGTDAYFLYPACIDDSTLIKNMAQKQKPILIQVGGIKAEEAEETIEKIKSENNNNIMLVHGFQSFPTRLEDIKLNNLKSLKKRFNLPVILEDHTDANTKYASIIPFLGITYGIHGIIKHFTIDRELKFIDYESALNPEEFKEFISDLREIEKSLGNQELSKFSKYEEEYRSYVRKRIVAEKEIKKGELITQENISFKRSEKGIFPSEKDLIIGKKAIKDIKKDEPLSKKVVG